MSKVRANNFTNKVGTGAPTFPYGVQVTGISTIGNVVVGGATTDVVINGDLRVTGIITTGTSSITIDAENDQIKVGSATTIHSTGYQIGSSNLHSTGLEVQNLNVSGVSTLSSAIVGTSVTITSSGLNVTGVVTATSFVGDGSGLTNVSPFNWTTKTSNYTALAKDGLFVNTSSGPITITLPSSPSTGDYIHFLDLNGTFATNNLTVARNGNNIIGVASDLVVDINNSGLTLVYTNATNGWKLMYF